MWVMAHDLGIRPWEIELLTVEQFQSAVAWLEAHNKKEDD